jgi:acyl homoserine lactone synthase
MILIVDVLNKNRFLPILDDMFRLRARVFQDRMGWDVAVTNGLEKDEFDALDPAYVIALDDDYRVIGCARLLQTTGPHMLSDVFHAILDGEPPLRSATMWESTRFCVDRETLAGRRGKHTVARTTTELMCGILEYAQASGISDIITVIDPVMDRILHRSDNAPYDYVGRTAEMGKVRALAALIDTGQERIDRVRAFAGVEGDIFVTQEEVANAIAPPTGLPGDAFLREYCHQQIENAASLRERNAAIALQKALSGLGSPARNFDT